MYEDHRVVGSIPAQPTFMFVNSVETESPLTSSFR